ncbi:MAG: hypothetical protein KC912_22065 [Proteobacteria bacterium]|nr:hypothetical protein [Pseudomonadota bacterium]
MFKWVILVLGLVTTAHAADLPEGPTAQPDFVAGPLEDLQADRDAAKAEEDAAAEARMAELEKARAGKAARVVVLKWKGSNAGYDNDTVQRNVRTRIARPDAKFISEIDLYQAGRKEPDRTKRPFEQRGSVPDEVIPMLEAAVADIETVPWNQMTEADWGITANNLRDLASQVWFIDRPELREPLFKLYVQIGRAAENQNYSAPPFYENIGGQPVNYYWFLAGGLASEDGELLASLSSQDLHGAIKYYADSINNGTIPKMTLAFEMEDQWDAKAFAGEYEVFINGLPTLISDTDSLLKVPAGRADVYLKRSDGHSISDSIQLDKLDDKIYFVRDVARKKMGIDFIDQLMDNPNLCNPSVDGDILTYLAIYAKLHMEAEIYISVAEAGNPNKVLIWKYDRDTATIQKILDPTGGFPIRFAAFTGAGVTFNGASVSAPDATCDPADLSCEPTPPAPEFGIGGIPVWFQLRVHYGRLFVPVGIEYTASVATDDNDEPLPFFDVYQTSDGHNVQDGDGALAYRERMFSRLIYTGVGVMLGKDAAVGLGPRGFLRGGWYNVPHMVDLTGHVGYTLQAPFDESTGRVRFLIDADAFAGVMIPIAKTSREDVPPTFGIQASAGITF